MNKINIRDFILSEDTFAEENENGGNRRKIGSTEYKTLFVSGCDFAVGRRTPKSYSMLVFLVSQKQMYIKNDRSGNIDRLNCENFRKFCADMPTEGFEIVDEEGNHPTWIRRIIKNSAWREKVLGELERENILEYIREGLLLIGEEPELKASPPQPVFPVKTVRAVVNEAVRAGADREKLTEAMSEVGRYSSGGHDTKEFRFLRSLFHTYDPEIRGFNADDTTYNILCSVWGIEGVYLFTRMYFQTPVELFPSGPLLSQILLRCQTRVSYVGSRAFTFNRAHSCEQTEFDLQKFADYMFCECTRQGFADDPDGFWRSWGDILNMQLDYYGKITDKYPENLISEEKILAYRLSEIYRHRQETDFDQTAAFLKQYEYRNDPKFMVIAPDSAQSLIEEGQHQSNCVASYIPRVVSGECMIFFVREKNRPEKSFVTVQVNRDGSLGQVKARFNREPNPDVKSFIARWHSRFFRKKELTA